VLRKVHKSDDSREISYISSNVSLKLWDYPRSDKEGNLSLTVRDPLHKKSQRITTNIKLFILKKNET